MKQVLIVAGLLAAVSNDAFAQGTSIHNRLGESGTSFTLSASTQAFVYEATVSGPTTPYQVELQVYHNGVLKHSSLPMPGTGPWLGFVSLVDMSDWGLRVGDVVTFVLTVTELHTGETLSTHSLQGEVGGT